MSDITSQNGRRAEPRPTPSKPIPVRVRVRIRTRVGAILLLVAAALAAACAPADEGLQEKETTTTASDADETATGGDADEDADGDGGGNGGATGDTIPGPLEPSITEEEVSARLEALGGKLGIGLGPQLIVARPDGRARVLLDGSESVTAAQPTWSDDGDRLAWGSFSAERQVLHFQEFDDDGLPTADRVTSDASGLPVFYLQWTEDGSQLAYIRNDATAAQVEVGTVSPGSPIEPGGSGAPFFISWSPNGERLVGHVNERSIDVFDTGEADGAFDTAAEVDGEFSAPDWLDDERVLIADDRSLAALDLSSGAVEALAELPGIVRFVLSPDRSRVAYQVVVAAGASAASVTDDDIPPGALTVLDVATGERTMVAPDIAVSWEWSPDSTKLAWMGIGGGSGELVARWNFWSSDGSAIGTPTTPEFGISRKVAQNYLPFFAQYAQSVRRWSPDSNAFAFAGTFGDRSGIWIQFVDETVLPVRVTDGDFVTWGDGDPLPPIGDVSALA